MTLTRRRFISIAAASLVAAPAFAQRWQGRALGAEVEITIRGPKDIAVPALKAARDLLTRVEAQFNLFDDNSRISKLNRSGRLVRPDAMFTSLMQSSGAIHTATCGLFDPTVQPLWRALAEGGDIAKARALIGWERVQHDRDLIKLDAHQALTFNGIAQGYATDRIAELLGAAGLADTLVNIGEFRATGGPWTLGLSDPVLGHLGTRTLRSGAIATSSPMAVPLMGQGHILHGSVRPRWSTVSVEARDATTADGFSTALTLAPLSLIRAVVGQFGIRAITLVDQQGQLMTIKA